MMEVCQLIDSVSVDHKREVQTDEFSTSFQRITYNLFLNCLVSWNKVEKVSFFAFQIFGIEFAELVPDGIVLRHSYMCLFENWNVWNFDSTNKWSIYWIFLSTKVALALLFRIGDDADVRNLYELTGDITYL